MSIIDQLKLTQEQRPAELSPEQRLRHKMCEALDKQLAAAIHDAGEGRPYERYEIEEVENPETGEVETRKVKKRFSRWWFLGDNGSYYFSLRYGGKSIEIKPKKTSIEVADEKQLVDTIKALQEAIKAGELDAPLKKAADARKAQFQKRSAKSAAQTA